MLPCRNTKSSVSSSNSETIASRSSLRFVTSPFPSRRASRSGNCVLWEWRLRVSLRVPLSALFRVNATHRIEAGLECWRRSEAARHPSPMHTVESHDSGECVTCRTCKTREAEGGTPVGSVSEPTRAARQSPFRTAPGLAARPLPVHAPR
jgi:hypothetical protein